MLLLLDRRPTLVLLLPVVLTGCRSGSKDAMVDASSKTVDAPTKTAASTDASTPPGAADVGPGDRSEIERACDDFAERDCTMLARCAPVLMQSNYGDAIECRREMRDSCLTLIAPPGSNATAATIAKCASAKTASCDQLIESSDGECVVPGPSADGAPCASNAECASRFCERGGKACGVCTRLPTAGEPCKGRLCETPLLCIHDRCVKAPRIGERCENVWDCKGRTRCFKGVCAAPAKLGQSCDEFGEHARDCDQELTCNDGRCVREHWVDAGAICNLEERCKGGSTCIDKWCVPNGREHEACGPTHPCRQPLWCIDGTCTKLDRKRCTK